jgi:hypothetical protein
LEAVAWPLDLFAPGPWPKKTKATFKLYQVTVIDLAGKELSRGVWTWLPKVGEPVSALGMAWTVIDVRQEFFRDVVTVEPR